MLVTIATTETETFIKFRESLELYELPYKVSISLNLALFSALLKGMAWHSY